MRSRVLFIGDPYRGDQERNIKRLFDLFAPVVRYCGGLPELFVSTCNRKSGCESWLSDWEASLKGESSSALLNLDLSCAAIFAFELSQLDRQYLDSAGVPWVSFEIHPIRFLNDLHFSVETSFPVDLSSLAVPDDYIRVSADVLRLRYGISDEADGRRLLVVGQTPIDKSVYFDGVFKKLSDYFDALDGIVSSYAGVDYRPHPYMTDAAIDTLIRSRYSAGDCSDWDFYKVLASGRYGAVCGISSSALREATYFGLDSFVLESRAKTFGLPVSYASLLRHGPLWLSGVLETELGLRKYEMLPAVPDNYLRQVFCSWAYVTKEDEARVLLSELKEQVAAVSGGSAQSDALVMQARLEERLAAAVARASQSEEHLAGAKNRVTELSVALEGVKSELVEVQTVARLQQAHFDDRLGAAEARAVQAEQNLLNVEARVFDLVGTLQTVKSDLVEAQTVMRLQKASFDERLAFEEARAAHAEQHLVEAEARAVELHSSMELVKIELAAAQTAMQVQQMRFEESAREQQSRLSVVEGQLADALTNNHYHWLLANERAEEVAQMSRLYDQVAQALQASEAAQSSLVAERDRKSAEVQYWHQRVLDLHQSTSWRLTKPLRGLKRLVVGEVEVKQATTTHAAKSLRGRAPALVEHGIRYVVRRRRLKAILRKVVALLPPVERRLVEIRTAQVRSDLSLPPMAIASVAVTGGTDCSIDLARGFASGVKRNVSEILDSIRAELGQQAPE